ncbi:MAG: hypothetical protein OCC49_03640 [Fibrobacterales bacterium]
MLINKKLILVFAIPLLSMGCDVGGVTSEVSETEIKEKVIENPDGTVDQSDVLEMVIPEDNGQIAAKTISRFNYDPDPYWNQVEPLYWNGKNRDVRQVYDKAEFSFHPVNNHLSIIIETYTSTASGAGTTMHPLLGVVFYVEYYPSTCKQKIVFSYPRFIQCGLNSPKRTAEWTVLFNLNDPADNDLRAGDRDVFYYDINFNNQTDFLSQADMDLGYIDYPNTHPFWSNKQTYPFRLKIKKMILAPQQGSVEYTGNDPWLPEKIKIKMYGNEDERLYLTEDVHEWVQRGTNVEWSLTSTQDRALDSRFIINGDNDSDYYWNRKPNF